MKNPFRKKDNSLPALMQAHKASNPQTVRPAPVVIDKREVMPVKQILDTVNEFYAGRQLQRSSNLGNTLSGAGGSADKSGFFEFMPFWLNSQQFIENITVQSWVADRFVNMPINDMFTKPRTYDDPKFKGEMERIGGDQKLATAMRTARKYGTGLVWAVMGGQPADMPLDPARVRPGDLKNLLVFSRYDAVVERVVTDIMSPDLGRPEYYRLNVHQVGSFVVHASHVYRFDGLVPDTVNGWVGYERDWGVSAMAHAMTEIFNDASTVQAVNHLVQEASIPVQKVQGLAELLCTEPAEDELSVEQRLAQVNAYKSIYRTLLMDSNDTFERINVAFSGIPDLLEKSAERLAMAAGISATRFLGTSPDGQNSTGDGDMRNDNRTTASRQHTELRPAYMWLDAIVAGSAGVAVPDYTFPPLYEPTQKELSEVEKTRSETVVAMTSSAVWDEEEAKEYLATGTLPDGAVSVDAGPDEPEEPEDPFAKKGEEEEEGEDA